jgi:hypothetical protein
VGDSLDDLVVDVAIDVQARAGVAALALVEEDAVPLAVDREARRLANEVLNVLRQALGKARGGRGAPLGWFGVVMDILGS